MTSLLRTTEWQISLLKISEKKATVYDDYTVEYDRIR